MDTKLAEQEVTDFVGKNAGYYYTRWTPLLEGQDWTGFNWAACFLSGFWLAYRKMYKPALVFYGAIFLVVIIEEIGTKHGRSGKTGDSFGFIASIVCGAYGNRWYFQHATRVITKVRSKRLPDNIFRDELSKLGGTNILAPIAFFVALVAAVLAVNFLVLS